MRKNHLLQRSELRPPSAQAAGMKTLFVMIPQYRPIYTPVHVHLVCGSILFPSSGGNSLVAKLSSGEPGVPGSSLMVSTSPLTTLPPTFQRRFDG